MKQKPRERIMLFIGNEDGLMSGESEAVLPCINGVEAFLAVRIIAEYILKKPEAYVTVAAAAACITAAAVSGAVEPAVRPAISCGLISCILTIAFAVYVWKMPEAGILPGCLAGAAAIAMDVERLLHACPHPEESRTVSCRSLIRCRGMTHHGWKETTVCGLCGARLSEYFEYEPCFDSDHDGKCDVCGVAMTTGSFTCKYIKSTPSGDYNEAYGNVDEAPGHQKSQSVTYWPVSKAQSSFSDFGSYYIKKSGGGTHFKHTFVGWSTACNNRFSGGWSTVTSNPAEYADITAAANAGHTGTLYAVYKYTRNSTTYYVCAK